MADNNETNKSWSDGTGEAYELRPVRFVEMTEQQQKMAYAAIAELISAYRQRRLAEEGTT